MTEKLVHEFPWGDVAQALFQAKGIKKGLWRVAVKMHFSAASGLWPEELGTKGPLPTGSIGVAGLALFETDTPSALTFDAATGQLVETAPKVVKTAHPALAKPKPAAKKPRSK